MGCNNVILSSINSFLYRNNSHDNGMGLYLQFNYTACKFHCQAIGVKLKGFGELRYFLGIRARKSLWLNLPKTFSLLFVILQFRYRIGCCKFYYTSHLLQEVLCGCLFQQYRHGQQLK